LAGPLPDKESRLSACLDANVLISAIEFGGKPDLIVQALLKRRFAHVTCPALLEETRRNLTDKIGLKSTDVRAILASISEVSTILEPPGSLKITGHAQDDLVLETAVLGGCDFLVTGDKQHLLPLGTYQNIVIEPPASVVKRLE
jgi:putative PIN family toxin of toxin-antitoxin system